MEISDALRPLKEGKIDKDTFATLDDGGREAAACSAFAAGVTVLSAASGSSALIAGVSAGIAVYFAFEAQRCLGASHTVLAASLHPDRPSSSQAPLPPDQQEPK